MEKDTKKMVEELGLSPDFKTFYDKHEDQMISQTLSQMLNALAKEKKLKKAQIIRNAELSEVYGYQIFSGARVPERKKLLCLAISMGLTLEEVQLLLKSAGYPILYVKKPFDSVVMYGICKRLAIIEINQILYENKLESL